MTATNVVVAERYFDAAGAIPQDALVELTATKNEVAIAGGTNPAIGVAVTEAFAAGDRVTVRLLNAQGTSTGIASGAIGANVAVYAAASGKLAAAGTVEVGVSLEASTADNDLIEFMPKPV